MNYTHYGNAGIPFALVKEYKNYDEMVSSFKLGPGYLDVRYGEYVIISSDDLDHGGEIYRREYNFKNNMGGAKFITNMNQGQREWAEEAKKQAERAQQAADSAEEITEIAYGLAETIINNELERIEAEQQRVEDFQEMEEIFTDLQGIQVSEEEPTSEKVGAWIKEGTEEDRFLLENTDIAQKLGQDKNKVTSQKLVNDTIELIDAKIENIEAELAVNSIADTDFAQEKVVPENILPQVQVTEIGGMTYKCNNLIPFPYQNKDGTVSSNITFKINSDNSVTVSGTTDSESYAGFQLADSSTFFFENGKTYNLQGTVSGFCWVYISYRDKNNTERWIMGTGSSFVWNKEWTFQRLYLQVPPNTTINNITVYPMLNEGETALPYEPYFTGLRDSKVTEVESVGVNLIPFPYASPTTTMNGVTWTVNDDDSITASGTATGYSYFTLSDNVPISKKEIRVSPNGVNSSNVRMIFRLLDANKNALFEKNVYNFEKINIADYPMATAFSSFLVRDNHAATTGTFLPMINYGAKGLAYSRGFRNTFKIPEAVQNLDGYGQGINKEYYNKIILDSKNNIKKFVQQTKRIVLDGTEKWTYSTTTERFAAMALNNPWRAKPYNHQFTIPCKSNAFDFTFKVYHDSDRTNGIVIVDRNIFIRDARFASADEFKAYLAEQYAAGTPAIAEYVLAEPIETDITDLFPDSNFIGAESGGTITAINEYGYDVPFTVEYKEKKNILSAEEIEEKLESKVAKYSVPTSTIPNSYLHINGTVNENYSNYRLRYYQSSEDTTYIIDGFIQGFEVAVITIWNNDKTEIIETILTNDSNTPSSVYKIVTVQANNYLCVCDYNELITVRQYGTAEDIHKLAGNVSKLEKKTDELSGAVLGTILTEDSQVNASYIGTDGTIVHRFPAYSIYYYTVLFERTINVSGTIRGTGVCVVSVWNSEKTAIKETIYTSNQNTELFPYSVNVTLKPNEVLAITQYNESLATVKMVGTLTENISDIDNFNQPNYIPANGVKSTVTQTTPDFSTLVGKTYKAVGDSITDGDYYRTGVGTRLNLTVFNAGLASSTLAINNAYMENLSIVERVCGLNGNVPYSDVDIWTVMGGLNDVLLGSPLGTIESTDKATIYGALKAICENLKSRPNNPKVILMTPTQSSRDNEMMREIVKAVKVVGKLYSCPVIDLYNESGICHTNMANVLSDGVHPNEIGSKMLVSAIASGIQRNC